ncbi:asparagine synthase (glutamine-hydrolyzing) [Anaerobacillus isosaccharinicus]|uniref:asparagine synthase (glutamine-hydrolyzing) n=1 Tax=Anaerobacillus isosaccharinicus TaxID=1532552 RepID=A0A1S2MH85_9BACI|nr:asparagine synthase (glutamine-hydrolyzing) [Anaerobacillus isosaccharinicus]MBA5584635.1 asparagine synthase (glutamine-hydrolyzing) [Anaerobacillus isosaccharinicus]QOY36990.1 asparagine synthase (glutamine-hydrolyzing) [Anaerobacillus isosaccharinicus]
MCGFICAIHETENQTANLSQLTNTIIHRGPDEQGTFEDQYAQLGFRRLSIIDLETGSQPLSFENERYWIVFNGELYNYIEIRGELIKGGISFQTNSDTEALLALYSVKKEKMMHDLRGMFAFVIWDKQEKTVFGARDPFGIKPLFFQEKEGVTYFSSEKKSILAIGVSQLNEAVLQNYLTYQYVPENETMSKNIFELEPGTYFSKKISSKLSINRYWKPAFQPIMTDLNKAKSQILNTLLDSVNVHMRSDVPVGAFLSGGIDSTAIVALAKEINPKIQTFTVGFDYENYSEISVAEKTAEKLQVEHFTHTITPEEFLQELPRIIWHLDDPVADPSVVPLYFLAREARKQVKVVLSGEGADELFGGYNIYREPMSLRRVAELPNFGKKLLKQLASMLPDGMKGKSFIERGCTNIQDRYIGNAKIFTELEKAMLLKRYDPRRTFTEITKSLFNEASQYDDVTKMQYIDMHTWLRGDILVKADRMTMAHSLELRVPFLDKEVFNVAATLSPNLKVTRNTTKYALREAMREIVPDHVLNRRKLGFPVPIRVWLKDTMYDWASNKIKTSNTDYLFHKGYLLKLLEKHAQGKGDYSRKIWTALTFMIWHEIYVEKGEIKLEEINNIVLNREFGFGAQNITY